MFTLFILTVPYIRIFYLDLLWCLRLVKVRIEDRLPTGERISVVLEGSFIDERKVLQLLELLRIMNGQVMPISSLPSSLSGRESVSLKELIWDVIAEKFRDGRWFTSKDLYEILIKEYNIKTKLSTVSTYLHRLSTTGYLEKSGSRALRKYRLRLSIPTPVSQK